MIHKLYNSYFLSLFFPSSSLLPLEYCLPLMGDGLEDLETIESFRDFIKERTGVELNIYS